MKPRYESPSPERKVELQRKSDETRLRNLKAREAAGELLKPAERDLMDGLEISQRNKNADSPHLRSRR